MTGLMSACVVVVVAMVAATNLALPKLSASSLEPSSTGLLWIVDAYILVFGCLLIPAGALGDRLGRKGVLLAGLATFAGGCLVAAAAPSVSVLIGGRVVTGIGAALVMPATLSLLLQVTSADRRPSAIAAWTAATGAAGALGNLGGGMILQWLPWQGLFLVAAPIALVLAAAVAAVAPRGERHPAGLDLIGAALLTGALLGLLVAIIEGPHRGWTSVVVIGAAAGSVVLLVTFVVHAMRTHHPLIDPRMFSIPLLRAGAIGVAAVFFGLFALFFVNAQYLQYVKGYSPLLTGVAILPLPAAMIVASRRSVGIASRTGVPAVVGSGMALVAAGLVGLSFVGADTEYLPYAAALVAVAVGMGLSVPALSTGIMSSLPPDRAGMGSGLNSAAREIGSALGVAVVGTVLASRFSRNLPPELGGDATSLAGAFRAADRVGPAARDAAAGAFTDAMSAGYRVVGILVLLFAGLVVRSIARGAEVDDEDPALVR